MASSHSQALDGLIMSALLQLYSPSAPSSASRSSAILSPDETLSSFQGRNRRHLQANVTPPIDASHAQLLRPFNGLSTYATCLSLLSSPPTSTSETSNISKIFAAQTILKRCMGMDIDDAVDSRDLLSSLPHLHDTSNPLSAPTLTVIHLSSLMVGEALQCGGADTTLLRTLGMAIGALSVRLYHAFYTQSTKSSLSAPSSPPPPPPPLLDYSSLSSLLSSLFSPAILQHTFPSSPQELPSAAGVSMLMSLSFVPDVCCGELGGRVLSIDPTFLTLIYQQLGSEASHSQLVQLCSEAVKTSNNNPLLYFHVMRLCERWATYVPMSVMFVSSMVPVGINLLSQSPPPAPQLSSSVTSFLLSIFDNGDDLLFADADRRTSHAPNNQVPHPSFPSALRTPPAVAAARISAAAMHSLLPLTDPSAPGGSPAAVVAAACAAVLPALYLSTEASSPDATAIAWGTHPIPDVYTSGGPMALFSNLAESLAAISSSEQQGVRALAYDAVQALCEAVVAQPGSGSAFSLSTVSFLTQTLMTFFTRTQYPPRYFDDLTNPYDEILEIERTDARELIRLVSGNSLALSTLVMQCHDLMSPPDNYYEPPVHAVSSLGRPLALAAQAAMKSGDVQHATSFLQIAHGALACLKISIEKSQTLIASCCAAPPAPPTIQNANVCLPFLRVATLSISTYTPFFNSLLQLLSDASLASVCDVRPTLQLLHEVLQTGAGVALQTCVKVKEYPVHVQELTPDVHELESLCGMFHSPGGEDHLGCLALSRLCCEAGPVAATLVNGLPNMIEAHRIMYASEQINDENRLVFGKSRRLVLKGIGRLCIIANNADALRLLVEERIAIMDHVINSSTSTIADSAMLRLTEAVLDLSEFDAIVIQQNMDKIALLQQVVVWGYNHINGTSPGIAAEWGRLRGALLRTLRGSTRSVVVGAGNNIPSAVLSMAVAIASREAEVALALMSNPAAPVTNLPFCIFDSNVIGPDKLEGGAYIQLFVESSFSSNDELAGVFLALYPPVLRLLSFHLQGSLASAAAAVPQFSPGVAVAANKEFEDPRMAIGDAMYRMGSKIVQTFAAGIGNGVDPRLENAIASMIQIVILDWFDVDKDFNDEGAGPSYDDYLSISIFEFFSHAFKHRSIIEQVAALLMQSIGQTVELGRGGYKDRASVVGSGLIMAALFNAASGRIPPWTIEYMPSVFESLLSALGGDAEAYIAALQIGIEANVAGENKNTNSRKTAMVGVGRRVLSGRYIQTLKPAALANLVEVISNAARLNTAEAWKATKQALKQGTGGKKKGTSWKQKAQVRYWLLDRL